MGIEDLLTRVGLAIEPEVLSVEQCERLREAASLATWNPATVNGKRREIDQATRDTLVSRIPLAESETIDQVLADLRSRFEVVFDVELGHYERPQLLRYGVGHFFVPHRDRDEDTVSGRAVSVSLLLNDQGTGSEEYEGGDLRFFDLMKGGNEDRRLAMTYAPPQGTAVGFRSHVLHEVAPIISGERFSIVTWFHGRST
jgi:predicted 2-oxoglutarate/Fe(II)-dependent dioxygenase YbiX